MGHKIIGEIPNRSIQIGETMKTYSALYKSTKKSFVTIRCKFRNIGDERLLDDKSKA